MIGLSEVAEVMAVGKWYGERRSYTGQDDWCPPGVHTVLLLSLVCMLAEAGEVDFDQPAADPVQHQESVVDPALFTTVPFQTAKQLLYGTR